MANIVHVKDISVDTTEKEVRDFFSFCGKINYLTLSPTDDGSSKSQSATVAFEKETAAKTALLLDNTQLGANHVHVTTATSIEDVAGAKAVGTESAAEGDVEQEDKPRSRILAEYLAHGYTVSDKAIENAIALDKQHGISSRFTAALQSFDTKLGATEKAQAVDAKYGVTNQAASAWQGLNSYFEKAMGTPTGQKLRSFYEVGNKQVMDVHNEARHLADLKAGKHTAEPVEGTNKTVCGCGGENSTCGCSLGKCSCSDCPKNSSATATSTTEKTSV